MRMKVNADGPVAQLLFNRSDGHKLSLSSMNNWLVEFDADFNTVVDYGEFTSMDKFLEVVAEFRKGEEN